MSRRAFVLGSLAVAPLAGIAVASGPVSLGSPHDKAGFRTAVVEGRLWVFRQADERSITEFTRNSELGRMVARVGAGPNRMTIRAADAETIDEYLAAR